MKYKLLEFEDVHSGARLQRVSTIEIRINYKKLTLQYIFAFGNTNFSKGTR